MASASTPSGSFSSFGNAQKELDTAMGSMRDNMTMMAERDSRLGELEGKSNMLQGTSSAFSRQARRLRWEMKWQQFRLIALAVCLTVWVACFYFFRHQMPAYLAASGAAFTLAYFVQRHVAKRWRAQIESEDTERHFLMSAGDCDDAEGRLLGP
ncbi:unnamed protein product [Polarella glacialis]|uniref:V-SNARE coiled-coil homology domain-containing protein n=1 Tax=Polarella glacialis TaxID=89957 RepID=A0A813KLI2_POLGL|nr:unnamed protein product [Polarella glacialis]CAE8702369.1 unnamed protein product [Polarella glacialis]|mmetsp:Transcript_72388/g.116726  ORF Transcript_72388/g.116726 Transcript_72388/m.116726 type:complete len:154 (-) Transcript_72388:154-615(-)